LTSGDDLLRSQLFRQLSAPTSAVVNQSLHINCLTVGVRVRHFLTYHLGEDLFFDEVLTLQSLRLIAPPLAFPEAAFF